MDEHYLLSLLDYASDMQLKAKNPDQDRDVRVLYLDNAIRILDKAVSYLKHTDDSMSKEEIDFWNDEQDSGIVNQNLEILNEREY